MVLFEILVVIIALVFTVVGFCIDVVLMALGIMLEVLCCAALSLMHYLGRLDRAYQATLGGAALLAAIVVIALLCQ